MNHLSSAHSHGLHNATQAPIIQPTSVLYYPLNGNILNYATGTGVSDITTGTGHFVSSHPSGTGNSQNIAGSTTYCLLRNIPITITSNVGDGFTYSFWYNNNATLILNTTYYMFGFGPTSGTTTYCCHWSIGGVGFPTNFYDAGGTISMTGFVSALNFFTTSWNHYAVVFTKTDSSDNFSLQAYRNGGLVTTRTNNNYTLRFITNACNYQRIGHSLNENFFFPTGYMSNFRMYNQPLTADQITYLYTNKL